MTFPATPLAMTVELLISGVWTDITARPVYKRGSLVVTRGRTDEGQRVERSTARFQVNNRDGNLSPRNPTGTWYGQIGRNSRCRVRVTPAPEAYLRLPSSTAAASTPDSAGTSITGDIDIRVDLQRDDWTVNAAGLCGKYVTTGNQRSWSLAVFPSGLLEFRWSPDGTFANAKIKASTTGVTVPTSGRLALRVTLDVDNGAAGNDLKFWTSDTISGTWTQLGATVTTAGTTSIFNSTAPTQLAGGVSDTDASVIGPKGRVYAFQVYQGIAGTLKVDVDLDTEDSGAGPFTDGSGNVWTLAGDAQIVTPTVRFQGEVSTWPQRWDPSGRDVYVPIEASGILRRLTQGATPLKSVLYRAYTTLATAPKAYWPCEDAVGSTSLASGVGGLPMVFTSTAHPTLATFTDFACSAALPTLQNSTWFGRINYVTTGNDLQVWWLMHIPTGAATVGKAIVQAYTAGVVENDGTPHISTVSSWRVEYSSSGGDLTVKGFDQYGTQLFSTATGFACNDKLLRVELKLDQNGADIDWTLATLEAGATVASTSTHTVAGRTMAGCSGVRVNPDGGLGNDIAVGHISVDSTIRSLAGMASELAAYAGEAAGRRVQRLCGEEDVAFRGVGDLDATAALGAQGQKTLVDLLTEAGDADIGILFEPRDLFGLGYRTRESMYDQLPILELDYSASHLSTLEPVDDDQQTRNDITVERTGGSSVRVVQETGALSILAPPDGVGRYDTQTTLNLETDAMLPDYAGWLLHLGTVDEARYPLVALDLARAPFVASSALSLAAQDLDEGDRLTITNPPSWLPPDQISLLAQGFTETMSNFTHRIEVNCSPETPWGQVGVYDDGESRYSSDGSTLAEDLTTTETGVDVATPSGPLWTHADGDFDVRVGGEVMTVTAVTGATSPQTFTVTRSVNGVVKTHLTGAVVELAHPRVYVP